MTVVGYAISIGLFAIVWRSLAAAIGPGVTTLLVAIRLSMVAIYAAALRNPIWTFTDDQTYLAIARTLLQSGWTPGSILDHNFVEKLFFLSQGPHMAYAYWNLIWLSLLGDFYYAPVVGNTLLSFLSVRVLYDLCKICGHSQSTSRFISVFFCIHPEIVSWTTIFNSKDIMIETVTMIFFYAFLVKGEFLRKILLTIFCLVTLSGLRYYLVVILPAFYLGWTSLTSRWRVTSFFILSSIVAIATVFFSGLLYVEYIFPASAIPNFIKSFLTPQPWALDINYTFLGLASTWHWLMTPFSVAGMIVLWKRPNFRPILVYFMLMTLFYASTPELLGPRHRFQVNFVYIWAQGYALLMVTKLWSSKMRQHAWLSTNPRTV